MFIRFDINGANVIFENEAIKYNSIRKEFSHLSQSLGNEFNKSLSGISLHKNTISEIESLGEKYISESIRKGLEIIIDYGLVTIDRSIFTDTYVTKYLSFKKNIKEIVNINNFNKKNSRNNTYLKNYEDCINILSKNLINDCFNIHYAIIDALLDNGVDVVRKYYSEIDIKTSTALFNNYKDGFIPKPDESEVVKRIITLNPYRKDIYEYLIKEDGDFNNEIERLCNFLGYNVSDYKETLIEEYIDSLIKLDSLNVDMIKEKLDKYLKYIGVNDIDNRLRQIDELTNI